MSYSRFLQQVQAGQVADVTIMASNSGASRADYHLKDGNISQTVLPPDYRDAMAAMQDKLVNIEIQDRPSGWPLVWNATPFFLLVGLWAVLFVWLRKHPKTRFLG